MFSASLGHLQIDFPAALDLGVIAGAANQPVGDARSAPGTAGDFQRAFPVAVDFENFRRAQHDDAQFLRGVKLQPEADAEAIPQGRGEHARPGGGADEGEFGQIQPDRAGRGALADHDVQGVILHGGIEHFLHGMAQPVDFVDKQHVACGQIGENGGQIPRALNGGAAGDSNIVAHFRGDNARQGGFAQAGRAVEQNMIQRLLPGQGGLHVNAEAVF